MKLKTTKANTIKTINKISFNDGYLYLQEDSQGNLLMCAVGDQAHKYYYKLSKIPESKLRISFELINNCSLII